MREVGMTRAAVRWTCFLVLAIGCGGSGRNFGTASNGGAGGTSNASSGRGGSAGREVAGRGATVEAGSGGDAGQGEGGSAGEMDAAGATGLAGEGGSVSGAGGRAESGTGGMSVDACAGVVCNAPDQCHQPGTCTPATGKCDYANKADNTPCSVDNNACTPDVCRAGVCMAGAAKTCPAPAVCKLQGACNTTSGVCSTPNADDHTSCGTNLECLSGACSCTRTSCPNGCCTSGGACGACTPSTIITRTDTVQDLTVGGGLVYFLEQSNLVYSLSTSPASGATPTMLSYPPPSATLMAIHLDGSYVYGGPIGNSTPAPLARMSSVGGPFNEIAGSATWILLHLASNTKSIFAGATLSSNYITVSPKDGSAASITLVSSPAINAQNFAVDDAFVYFISASSTVLSRVPVGGGGATTVTTADSGETFSDVAVSGSQLVIATSKRVAIVPSAGGSAGTLDTGAAYAVRADATNAYYFRSKGSACASGSELYAMPLAGGNLRRLVVEPATTCVRSVVQDPSAVFWVADKSIKKIAK